MTIAGPIVLAACASTPLSDPILAQMPAEPRVACALTFDDGPGRNTTQLLDVLKARNVKATFFVLGQQVRREPDVVRRMAAEGHEVDNHSFDHPDFRHLSRAEQQREIDATQAALRSLGIVPKYFRPPYGDYDPETVRAAARDGLTVVLWTTDGKDWKYHTVHALEAYVDRELKIRIGGIYLFHDILPWTVAAMPEILDRMAERGCRFVTLAQFFAETSAWPASGSQ
jgi:peptidoglycan/xylan/chitin deacetylase (PgdA/CDA1 family)